MAAWKPMKCIPGVPLDRVTDVFDESPGPKRMFVLARADHQHFVDAVEEEHEAIRAMSFPGAEAQNSRRNGDAAPISTFRERSRS